MKIYEKVRLILFYIGELFVAYSAFAGIDGFGFNGVVDFFLNFLAVVICWITLNYAEEHFNNNEL